MEVTVHRALASLKLTDAKIEKKINGFNPCIAKPKKQKHVNNVQIENLEKNIKSELESIESLIAYKTAVKAAIMESNTTKEVTLPNGTKATIATAIEMKREAVWKQKLLTQMTRSHMNAQSKLDIQNRDLEAKADKHIETVFGGEKASGAAEARKQYIEDNSWDVIDPLKAEEKLKKMRDELDDFLSNIDFILSESNATEKVNIPEIK